MKLTARRDKLYQGLQRLGGVVASGVQQPIYRNVRLEAAAGALWLSATDLEVGLKLQIKDVRIEDEGVTLLPHARVTPVVGATPDEQVLLREEDGIVVIETSNSNFRILGEDPEDFADLPPIPEEGAVEVDPEVLKYMIRRTVFAAAPEKGRYALNGVLLVIGKEGSFEAVAADGARLAHVRKKTSNPAGIEAEVIVPTKGAEQLARLADYGKDPVALVATETQLMARNEAGRFVCQLVEGQFPNYREVIPTDSKVKVDLPARELLGAVRRAAFVTTEETRVVDFCLSEGTLAIVAEAPDVGHAEVRMPVDYDGPEAMISFNPEFVEDMLSVVERETVKMRFVDRRSPCVFKAGMDYTYVVSPVIREEGEP